MMSALSRWKQISAWFGKHGDLVVTGVCVGVIIGTAVWTGKTGKTPAPMPSSSLQPAAHLMQQSLADAATPTPTPECWLAPLDSVDVLRSFDADDLQFDAATGIWRFCDAVLLKAETGSAVYAMHSGWIVQLSSDGGCMIDHGEGFMAAYSGLDAVSLKLGDPVEGGDLLGVTAEPQLHLRITQNGSAIDPLLLFSSP